MNKHYVCTGDCGGVSDKPGVCQADTCPRHLMPLSECSCSDGRHEGFMKACTDCGKLCQGKCDIELYKEEIA